MPLIDLVVPGSLLLLKLVSKTLAGQSADRVIFLRAIVSLPIDIVFMGLSFIAAAIILAVNHNISIPLQYFIGVLFVSIAFSFIICWLTHIATSSFFSNSTNFWEHTRGTLCLFGAFLISLIGVIISVYANGYIGIAIGNGVAQ